MKQKIIHATKLFSRDKWKDDFFSAQEMERHKAEYEVCSKCPYPAESAPCGKCPLLDGRAHKRKEELKQIIQLHEQGKTDDEIAKELKSTVKTVRARRKLLGLKGNYKNKLIKENPCDKCPERTKKVCREFRSTCSDRALWEKMVGI